MTDDAPNAESRAFWSDQVGRRWAELAPKMDHHMSRVLEAILEVAEPRAREDAIDVGCGAGALTEALAEAVGRMGSVLGIDLSRPLLDAARERLAGASHVRLVEDDAQTRLFPPESADLVTSRFGVMFFDDPVAAFANLHSALRPGGRIAVAAWAAYADNPWFRIPREAAAKRFGLGSLPPLDDETGPFGLARTERTIDLLARAGIDAPGVETRDVDLLVRGTAGDAADLASGLGPVSAMMREKDGSAEDLEAIRTAIATAFGKYETEGEVRVPGRIHIYTGRKA